MRLTGKDIPRKLITKIINVQQCPGRAAGVVFPKVRPVVFHQQKLYNVDGSSGGSLIKLKVQYNLGTVILDVVTILSLASDNSVVYVDRTGVIL